MQKPPLVLPTLYIGAQPIPDDIDLIGIGGGFSNGSSTFLYSDHYGVHSIVDTSFTTLRATIQASEQEYASRISQLPQTIEHELAATRLEGSTTPLPPADAIIRELGVRHTLLLRKTAEFHSKTAIANSFYGVDPIGRSVHEFHPRASSMGKSVDVAMPAWIASYRAAYDARLLSQTIQLLNQQSVNVQNFLRAVQANDQARMAAEQQAQRVAAELARINAQAEAQAREQARLAALAQAQRMANEQAQVAAEAAARHVAAEQAHLAVLAEQVRIAQEVKAREENAAKARAEREAQSARLGSLIASLENAQTNRPFPVSGHAAAVGPVFTVAAGNLATSIETNLALKAALRTAVSAVITAATASAGAIIGGFAALLFPSPLANSDLHALSVPLSDLTPDDLHDLHAIAVANGEIELPVAIGSRTVGNTTEFFVAATNGTTVPSKVPVRLATRDPDINVYRSYNPDTPSTGMTWTPIVDPDNASTSLPISVPNIFVYNGTSVTAVEGRVDVFPELDLYSFGGFITVFPAESGLPAIYTMFRDRRDDSGVAIGYGEPVSGIWLEQASQGDGAVIPDQIAAKLQGQHFSSFRAFREAHWRAVIDNPELAKQFTANNIQEMKNGRAPFSRKNDRLGGQVKFELHHVNRISKGGEIYDIDNIRIVTPKRHSEIHKGGK